MNWIYLLIAGILECGWAVGLKYSEGFTRLLPAVFTVGLMALSLGFLGLAMRTIPVGTAYAVWTGIGATGVAVLGMLLFGEPADLPRILSILLVVAGITGLKIFSRGAAF